MVPKASVDHTRNRRSAVFVSVALVAGLAIAGAALAFVARAPAAAPTQAPKVRALVRILGVLRRPQTEADRRPDPFADAPGMAPVRSLQRLARTTSWGAKVYIVPLVKTSAHGLPLNPNRGGLGLSVGEQSGGCCETAEQVEAGQSYTFHLHPGALVMVVPDEVTRVSVALGAPPGHRPLVVNERVYSNIAVVPLTHFTYHTIPGWHDLVTWYARSGAMIKKLRLY